MPPRPLTHLEFAALANIAEAEGCTAYEVMRQFSKSGSDHFRSGAGSIYPLISRLAKRGLIRGEEAFVGKRASQVYQVTAEGRRVLASWLMPPFSPPDISVPPDPLRTRVYFLGTLNKKERKVFFEGAIRQLNQEIEAHQERLEPYRDDHYGKMAMEGALAMLHARKKWLIEALAAER